MADKPPLPPAPGMTTKPKQPKPSVVASAAPQPPATRPMPAPPLKKPPPLAPPRQGVPPLKPPPAHHYRQHQQAGAPPRKHRQHHRSSCSCRRVCCVATGLVLLFLCLAFAASCLAYLYYHPHPPSFHLQPLSLTRFKITNSSAVSAMDATLRAKLVSWNPNDRVAFEYGSGSGEGRVALADADGDVELGWGPVVLGGQGAAGIEHAPRSVAALGFAAAAKGVVVDEAVAGRVRERYRRRQLVFKVVVDTHVGVRLAGVALRTGMVPVRVFCDGGAMAPRGSSAAGSPMSKCQVYLFRMKWLSLN